MISPSVNRAFRPGNFFGTNIPNGAYSSGSPLAQTIESQIPFAQSQVAAKSRMLQNKAPISVMTGSGASSVPSTSYGNKTGRVIS